MDDATEAALLSVADGLDVVPQVTLADRDPANDLVGHVLVVRAAFIKEEQPRVVSPRLASDTVGRLLIRPWSTWRRIWREA